MVNGLRSKRQCCVCHNFGGRDVEVHHIKPEADGGPNTLANAIVLCFKCHSEAGHYNSRHPKGSKYSPQELLRHRDAWWAYCDSNFEPSLRPDGYREPMTSSRGVQQHRRDVGVLWSLRADIPAQRETFEFEARLLAEERNEDLNAVIYSELFARPDGTFLVYVTTNHRGDWCEARLDGAPPDSSPLTLDDLDERHRGLASLAGLQRVTRI